MTENRPARRTLTALVALAPVAFVVIAEAAWISVIGGLVEEFSQREPRLGIPALVPWVVAGIVAAHVLGPRLGARWPVVALGLVALTAGIGVLFAPEARAALETGIGAAIGAHPGGWVVGLAVLRGFAHARLPLREGTVTRLLGIGVPGLAVAALVGGAIGDPFRARFLADALGAAIVFVAAGVLSLAFARLGEIGEDGGFDWRANPSWLALTVGLLVVAVLVALPLSAVAGTAISLIISVALGPLFIVGLASGFDRAARRVLGFFVVVVVIAWLLARGPLQVVPPGQTGTGQSGPTEPSTAEQVVTMSLGGLVLLGIVVAILVLVTLWMKRTRPPEGGLLEERSIDAGGDPFLPPRRWRRLGRRTAPTNAAAAYVALVDDLDRHLDVRRAPSETPGEHAARLRSIGRADLSLDLLAADYALARYGGATLSSTEDRRAIGRWRRLRKRIAVPPPGWVAPDPDGLGGRVVTAESPVPPVDAEVRRAL